MTDGTTRRKELMKMLQHETKPLSGTELAKHFGVSRQVIVQDIALLRATDRNILSTNKGYVLFHPEQEKTLQKDSCVQSRGRTDAGRTVSDRG